MGYSSLELVFYCHDIAMREKRSRQSARAKLIFIHKYGSIEKGCCITGELITGLWLCWRGRQYRLPLSVPHLQVMDFLGRQHYGKTATEIADGLSEPFYIHHGANASSGIVRPARATRTAVRKIIERIRSTLSWFFRENGIDLNPCELICDEPTSSREIKYRITVEVAIEH